MYSSVVFVILCESGRGYVQLCEAETAHFSSQQSLPLGFVRVWPIHATFF